MASPVRNGQTAMRIETSDQQHDSQTPSKRKSTDVASENGAETGKKKRRKVNHACVYCRRSHMTCDLERPCARCVKRDIGHLCHDEPRDPPKRQKSEIGVAEIAPAPERASPGRQPLPPNIAQLSGVGDGEGDILQPKPMSPAQMQRPQLTQQGSNPMLGFDWNQAATSAGRTPSGPNSQFQDMHHLHPNYMFNTSETTNEYNLLNDFLNSSLLDDGAMYNGSEDVQSYINDPLLSNSNINALSNSMQQNSQQQQQHQQQQQQHQSQQQHQQQQQQQQHGVPPLQAPPQAAGIEISRPSSAFPVDNRARDKFFMTAADPAGNSSAEDRLHKLLKAKYDAGMLKPFNYVKGYARLNSYMETHFSTQSRMRILRQLNMFRPKFREAMHLLTDIQLVLVEMWFERSLMEYDRVFAAMAIPACCWRRTGEIFRGNREMAELLGVGVKELRDGKLAIHDIIAEDSLVGYWEKFGSIAFDKSQKAILTSCALKHPENAAPKADEKEHTNNSTNGAGALTRCCFSFTIKRDTHNIPSLIVGNFIPIKPRPVNP